MASSIMKLGELTIAPKKAVPPDELDRIKQDLAIAATKSKHILDFAKRNFKKHSNPNAD